MQVTPEQARQWLMGSKQSNVEMPKMIKYATRLMNGEWNPKLMFNSPVIIRKGYVRDGHHRLFAILLADMPAECNVRIDE